jgi:hypothetical protein
MTQHASGADGGEPHVVFVVYMQHAAMLESAQHFLDHVLARYAQQTS